MTHRHRSATAREVRADDPRLKDGWLVRQLVALVVGLAVLPCCPWCSATASRPSPYAP